MLEPEFTGQLDVTFQKMLLGLLLKDSAFVSKARAIIDPYYFTADVFKMICKVLFDYWDVHKKMPNPEVLKVSLCQTVPDTDTQTLYIKVLEELVAQEDLDAGFIQHNIVYFAQRAEAMGVVLEAAKDPKHFDIHNLKRDLDRIEKLPALFTEMGVNVREQWSVALEKDRRHIFPTSVPMLDKCMRGGMREGELVTFLAPLKKGKSTILTNMGVFLMKSGFRVVHYTLEMYELDTARRYLACISGAPTNTIEKHFDHVGGEVLTLDLFTHGNIIVKEFPGKTTVDMIEGHLATLEDGDGEPWVPIIDYADLLTCSNNPKEEWMRMEEVYIQLRNMGRRHHVPVITASQTNAGGFNADELGPQHFAGSTRKGFVCDYTFSVDQSKTDYIARRLKIIPILNRNEQKGTPTKWRTKFECCQIVPAETDEELKGWEDAGEEAKMTEYASMQVAH